FFLLQSSFLYLSSLTYLNLLLLFFTFSYFLSFLSPFSFFFFFNDTATTEIYTLSLHDALPISRMARAGWSERLRAFRESFWGLLDRKSTRLNSSHVAISYAVFCLKKKKIRIHWRKEDIYARSSVKY